MIKLCYSIVSYYEVGDLMDLLKLPLKVIASVLVGLGIVLPLMLGVLVPYGLVLKLIGS